MPMCWLLSFSLIAEPGLLFICKHGYSFCSHVASPDKGTKDQKTHGKHDQVMWTQEGAGRHSWSKQLSINLTTFAIGSDSTCTLPLLPRMALIASARGALHGTLWRLAYISCCHPLAMLLPQTPIPEFHNTISPSLSV